MSDPWATVPDCPHVAPRSCRVCDNTASDEWAMKRAAEDRFGGVRYRMRRDREYRKAWLLTFTPSERETFAEVADRMHGPMPGLLDEIRGEA